jgi:hypothetical protein
MCTCFGGLRVVIDVRCNVDQEFRGQLYGGLGFVFVFEVDWVLG